MPVDGKDAIMSRMRNQPRTTTIFVEGGIEMNRMSEAEYSAEDTKRGRGGVLRVVHTKNIGICSFYLLILPSMACWRATSQTAAAARLIPPHPISHPVTLKSMFFACPSSPPCVPTVGYVLPHHTPVATLCSSPPKPNPQSATLFLFLRPSLIDPSLARWSSRATATSWGIR